MPLRPKRTKPTKHMGRSLDDTVKMLQEGIQEMRFCRTCKFYRPNKEGTPKFIFGYWSGDGRCENPEAWSETEYPYPKPHNITVETSSCEHHQPKRTTQNRVGRWRLEGVNQECRID